MSTEFKVENFIGKTVTTTEGTVIGKVHELVVSVDSWKVTNLQVEIDKPTAKELGIKTKLFGTVLVLIETQRVNSVADQVVIDVPAEKFAEYTKSLAEES